MTNPHPADSNREIRVFLSSTFRDMEVERDHLLKHVFPRVRQACAERKVGFTEIDLRWGITEEASKNGRTIDICLDEIERCRDYPPFFIGFLGERYGWVPRAGDLDEYWKQQGESGHAARIREAVQRNLSVTELEMRFGVLDQPHGAAFDNACFFLRDSALTAAHFAATPGARHSDFYDDGDGRLDALKDALRASGRVELDGYQDVAAFGERILAALLDALDERYPPLQAVHRQQVADAHARFAASRRQGYVALPVMREAVRAGLGQRFETGTATPALLYVSGPSGSGKSALVADLARWLPGQVDGVQVHDRYCGADGGHDIDAWRDDLADRLRQDTPGRRSYADANAAWDELLSLLARAAQAGPLCLLIDAVDQFNDPGQALRRLAALAWPPGVAVVLSGPPLDAALPGCVVLPLPAPSAALCADIVASFTSGYRKALEPALAGHLAVATAGRPPLFLRLALEHLRVQSRHETLGTDLQTLLACPTPEALFALFLHNWNTDYGSTGHPAIAMDMAALLAASRAGLDETELADLLAAPGDPVSAETGKARLPSLLLKQLLAAFRPYLLRNDGRDALMHSALLRAVPTADRDRMRARIAAHFTQPTARAVTERIHQYAALQDAHGGGHEAALHEALAPLADLLRVPARDRIVVRDALRMLGAGSADASSAAVQLARGWADQLGHAGVPGAESAANAWLLDLLDWGFHACALPLAERLLALRRGHAGEGADAEAGRAQLAVSLNNLAQVHQLLGDMASAEPLLREALALNRAAESLDIVFNLQSLSSLYLEQGKLADARLLAQEALYYRRRFLRDDPERLAAGIENLGIFELQMGKADGARAHFEEALDLLRAALPPGHPAIAVCLSNLGEAFRQLDQPRPALAALEEALAIRRATLPAGHPKLATVLNNLGAVYHGSGAWKEALGYYSEALGILAAALPPTHPDIASTMNNLAQVCGACGMDDEAEQLYLQALQLVRTAQPGHPDLAGSLHNLGVFYLKRDRCDEAEPLLREALVIHRAFFPAGHARIKHNQAALAALYQRTGNRTALAALLAPDDGAPPAPPEASEQTGLSQSSSAGVMKVFGRLMDMVSSRADAGSDADVFPGATGPFGLAPTNPVPCRGMAEYHAYFRNLRTEAGEAVGYRRLGSVRSPVSDNPVDMYEVSNPAGDTLATMYVSVYAKKTSKKAPQGFILTRG